MDKTLDDELDAVLDALASQPETQPEGAQADNAKAAPAAASLEALNIESLEQGDTVELPYYLKRWLQNKHGVGPTDTVLCTAKVVRTETWEDGLVLLTEGRLYMEWGYEAPEQSHVELMSIGIRRAFKDATLVVFQLTQDEAHSALHWWRTTLDARAYAQKLKAQRASGLTKEAKPAPKAEKPKVGRPKRRIDIDSLLAQPNLNEEADF